MNLRTASTLQARTEPMAPDEKVDLLKSKNAGERFGYALAPSNQSA